MDNSPNVVYEATLQDTKNTTVRGWLTLWAPPSKVGVKVHADFWGLPDGEPLFYHINEHPVSKDGNCYSTGGRLDPYKRGETPGCDTSKPHTCQVGDLSGKHSPLYTGKGESYEIEYTDLFLSTDPKKLAFFGNHSVVVQYSNGTRLNCANFKLARHQSLR
ncbi:hypothetical protein MW887_006745 [Aspergillus wentii]|nr:hypothetical protein MW887_006745 [Aspergillus wentii]